MSTFATRRPRAEPLAEHTAGGSVLGRVCHGLALAVVLGVAAVVTVAVLVPRLGGATPYTILTDSMSPGMPSGTLVVVKPRPADQIGIGDVITYQLESGKPIVVTHRVIAVGSSATGERTFVTKGDANQVADATPVRPVQVRGVRWYAVPRLGYLTGILSAAQRHTALLVVVAMLLGYAVVMVTGDLRDRVRRAARRRREVSA